MISVIIPVYNCENSLDRCVNSVLNQTYKDIEIVLVNDGSKDSSGQICHKYAGKYGNVICKYKKNEGVSSARNLGLEIASGDYIQFVDADDYLNDNMCAELMEAGQNADLVICGYNLIKGGNIKPILPGDGSGKIHEIDKIIPNLFSDWLINSPCNKLYKRQFINSSFNKDCSLGEDLLFNFEYIKGISSFSCVNKALYNYISDNAGSLTKQRGEEYIHNIKNVYNESILFCSNFCCNKKTVDDITSIYVDSFIDFILCNIKNGDLIEKIVRNEFTVKVFESYEPPSLMQAKLRNFVLKGRVGAVRNYVRLRGLLR